MLALANEIFHGRNFYSVRQEIAWLTYLLEVVVQHRSLKSRGFVVLLDSSNGKTKNFSRRSQQYTQGAINGAFPIRLCSFHGFNASPLVQYVLFPVFQRLRPKDMRLRTKSHRGSGEDLLRSLAEFNLPRDRLPSDIGGSVVLDINQFVIDRLRLEASHAGINLEASETDNLDQADRAGSTLSSATPNHNEHGQASPIDVPSAAGGVAAAASRETEAGSKRKRARNVVDPRMAKAVRAKQEDPDLKLHDALIIGGFVFTQKGPKQTDFHVFDEDGVSLKQRKNNLCTRLKREQTKIETKKASEPVGDDRTTPVAQTQASSAMPRRDSFDEQIQSLPGLDGLDDWMGRL